MRPGKRRRLGRTRHPSSRASTPLGRRDARDGAQTCARRGVPPRTGATDGGDHVQLVAASRGRLSLDARPGRPRSGRYRLWPALPGLPPRRPRPRVVRHCTDGWSDPRRHVWGADGRGCRARVPRLHPGAGPVGRPRWEAGAPGTWAPLARRLCHRRSCPLSPCGCVRQRPRGGPRRPAVLPGGTREGVRASAYSTVL